VGTYAQEEYRNVSWACRARTRCAKHLPGTKLVRNVKGTRKTPTG